jgi:hypothetical protein
MTLSILGWMFVRQRSLRPQWFNGKVSDGRVTIRYTRTNLVFRKISSVIFVVPDNDSVH